MVSSMDALKERVTWLENLVGEATNENRSLMDGLDAMASGFLALETLTANWFKNVLTDMLAILHSWKEKLLQVTDELTLVKKVVYGHTNSGKTPWKIKVPNPKAFGGNRSAKELENFLWDMEQYFKIAHV